MEKSKKKISRLIIQHVGQLLISAIVVVTVYSTISEPLNPISMIVILGLLVIGVQLMAYGLRDAKKILMVQSIILSLVISFGISFLIGWLEGIPIDIIITASFITLPTMLVFDALVVR